MSTSLDFIERDCQHRPSRSPCAAGTVVTMDSIQAQKKGQGKSRRGGKKQVTKTPSLENVLDSMSESFRSEMGESHVFDEDTCIGTVDSREYSPTRSPFTKKSSQLTRTKSGNVRPLRRQNRIDPMA